MKERTIKLTIDENADTSEAFRHIFLISINDFDDIEIRVAGAPIASRDTSVDTIVGVEPSLIELRLSVEETP